MAALLRLRRSLFCLLFLLVPLLACSAPEPQRTASSPALALEDLLAPEISGTGGKLVSIAQQQLGRPYRYGGVEPSGFDCSGLVYYVHRQAGYEVPRTSREQYRLARKIGMADLIPGDLVFFKITANKISHVGIYIADNLFIHSPSSGKGVSYASLGERYWHQRLVGAGRLH